MKTIFKFFDSELDRLINVDCYIDCRSPPQKLLRELRSSSQQKKLIKYFQATSSNPFKIIKTLSIANILMIYSKDYFSIVEQHLKYRISKDEWLNVKFIEPYYRLLIRCCGSKDMYLDSKNLTMKKGEAMQMLFYTINQLKLLFKVVEKMPFLGRYYKNKYNEVVSSAVQIIALQAQRLYGAFKQALTQILYQRQFYIKSIDDQTIMRAVLVDELTFINEEMKKLFLDKYFYPLGRGIGVKLFRPEEQGVECEKTIHAIVSNHEDTERQNKRQELQRTLFPGSGLVNWNFYEETLLQGPMSITGKLQESTFKQLDDIIISEDQNQQVQPPANFIKKQEKGRLKQGHSDKQTNTGTVQHKGSEM